MHWLALLYPSIRLEQESAKETTRFRCSLNNASLFFLRQAAYLHERLKAAAAMPPRIERSVFP